MSQLARLRKLAFKHLPDYPCGVNGDALAALAEEPDVNAWVPWQQAKATSGQWFFWRDPLDPTDMHADKVEPDDSGFIEIKYGCGLNYYPECQPLQMADDVKVAVEAAERRSNRASIL